jgi:hypothetical protein
VFRNAHAVRLVGVPCKRDGLLRSTRLNFISQVRKVIPSQLNEASVQSETEYLRDYPWRICPIIGLQCRLAGREFCGESEGRFGGIIPRLCCTRREGARRVWSLDLYTRVNRFAHPHMWSKIPSAQQMESTVPCCGKRQLGLGNVHGSENEEFRSRASNPATA